MQWSKLKTRIKALICPELSKRLDFHITSYRESHDGVEKAWVTLDGEKIFNCGHYAYEFTYAEGYYSGLVGSELVSWLEGQEIHSPKYLVESLRAYLDTSIEDALQSTNPFIKALAIIDRRVGKRRLDQMKVEESEHSLVKRFYELRYGIHHV